MFNELTQRYSDVEVAPDATLDWIYELTKGKLANWLESGYGIFWISGQTGSGK